MILHTIVDKKREEVALLRKNGIQIPKGFQERAVDPPRRFRNALIEHDDVSIIAEVKKASPSKGIISADFDPVSIARSYEKHGAQAVSVLTDVDFFQGSLLYLMQVRQTVSLPVLRKDFIIDELQIEEAVRCGADAILLIAAILDRHQITDFKACAGERGVDSLVEVHDEVELEKALESGADLVGINNRNLNDFSVDIQTTFRLNELIPDSIPVVSESGLSTPADVAALRAKKICAALIGESLMRAGSDGTLLGSLRES